jgi:hypothetical protein
MPINRSRKRYRQVGKPWGSSSGKYPKNPLKRGAEKTGDFWRALPRQETGGLEDVVVDFRLSGSPDSSTS